MGFLPEGYKIPVTQTQFCKLQDGENKFRILSEARVGYEYWKGDDNNREVVRVKTEKEVPSEHLHSVDGRKRARQFWAFIIYNYNINAVQLLVITQKTIQKAIVSLVEDKDWGDPKDYDLMINKSGQELETEYNVQPKPKTELSDDIKKIIEQTKFNIDGIYENKVFEEGVVEIDDIPF